MKTVNLTIQVTDDKEIHHLEISIRKYFKLVDFKILPETRDIYDKEENFRKIVKGVKDAQLIRDRYINDYRLKNPDL